MSLFRNLTLLATLSACEGEVKSKNPDQARQQEILNVFHEKCLSTLQNGDVVWNEPFSVPSEGKSSSAFPNDFAPEYQSLGLAHLGNPRDTIRETCSCRNGKFANLVPEEVLNCTYSITDNLRIENREGVVHTSYGSNEEYTVEIIGVGQTIPQGAIHDPVTRTTTPNDNTYAVNFSYKAKQGDTAQTDEHYAININPSTGKAVQAKNEEPEQEVDAEAASALRQETLQKLYDVRLRLVQDQKKGK